MRGYSVSPWLVRRKPGTKREFQVVSFYGGETTIAKDFDNLDDAQEFAMEANLMIGRAMEELSRT